MLYHKDNIVFGPALIRAYDLEQLASYPRVILEPDLAKSLGKGDKYLNKDGALIGISKIWREDKDDVVFYDFLQPFHNSPDVEHNSNYLNTYFGNIKGKILNKLNDDTLDISAHNKYSWLASYFNDVIFEYTEHDVDPIGFHAI